MKRPVYLRIVLVLGAVLLAAGPAYARHPKPKPISYNVIDVANRWFGMSLEDFEKAAGIKPDSAALTKTTSLSGAAQTQLTQFSAPVMKDLVPENINIMVYVFDDSGHLVEMDGYVAQGVSDVEAAGRMSFINGMPLAAGEGIGYMWAKDDVAVEIFGGSVFIWRLPAGCAEAIKASTPMEGCGRP